MGNSTDVTDVISFNDFLTIVAGNASKLGKRAKTVLSRIFNGENLDANAAAANGLTPEQFQIAQGTMQLDANELKDGLEELEGDLAKVGNAIWNGLKTAGKATGGFLWDGMTAPNPEAEAYAAWGEDGIDTIKNGVDTVVDTGKDIVNELTDLNPWAAAGIGAGTAAGIGALGTLGAGMTGRGVWKKMAIGERNMRRAAQEYKRNGDKANAKKMIAKADALARKQIEKAAGNKDKIAYIESRLGTDRIDFSQVCNKLRYVIHFDINYGKRD